MRTINKISYERMVLEAEEADLVGKVALAENLTRQIEKAEVRLPEESYVYSSDDFQKDIQENIWNIIVRTADFHGVFINSDKAQILADQLSDEVVDAIRSLAKIKTPVGTYEPSVPGQDGGMEIISIEE